MRLKRLLSIVFLLLNREKIKAKELSEKFNVSLRTIYRDIQVINSAGIPIISTNGFNGGISILPDFRIDRQVLSLKEMQAIISALQGVNDSLKNRDLDLIIEKISDMLPGKPKEKSATESEVVIDLIPWGMAERSHSNIRKINLAMENKNIIRFLYSKIDGPSEERYVEPMTIIFKGYTWYLFGYCKLRKDYRVFRISRIKNLQVSDLCFIKRRKSYKDYINWNEQTKEIKLMLKFSGQVRTAVEDYFTEKEIEYDEQGDLIVRTQMPESGWLYGFILSYGSFVEVLEPKEYRQILHGEASKIKRLYDKKTPA